MIEVLWHGRGGQGAFTAARLLGAAASLDDKRYALAFPSFGPERRGAPMRAFTKIDTVQIGDRSAVSKADFVIYLDGTLLAPDWERELKPGGICLVNTADASDDPRLLAIDADGITLSSAVSDMGQGKEIIACQTVGDNLPLNIAFNSRYMTDFFKNCGTDRVSLETNQSLSPARLMPEGDESYTYILTPVRVIF